MESDITPIIIKNALLIDGINPHPKPESVIVVEGSHITAVGELGKISAPQGKVIDAIVRITRSIKEEDLASKRLIFKNSVSSTQSSFFQYNQGG